MGEFTAALRRKDSERLFQSVFSQCNACENWVVQGLPDTGVEFVFADLCKRLKNLGVNLIYIDVRAHQLEPVAALVYDIVREVKRFLGMTEQDPADQPLASTLAALHSSVKAMSEQDRSIVIALDSFDVLVKFAEPEQVQHMLNMLQSLGSSTAYKTTYLLRCYRNVEDICRSSNYSDFHKIFGSNLFRLSNFPSDVLLSAFRERYQEHAGIEKQVIELSGGYPEHVEVLMRHAGSTLQHMVSESVNDLSVVFDGWLNCLTSDESEALRVVKQQSPTNPEHQFAIRKLLKKGILSESTGMPKIASPLFESYLSEQIGKTEVNEQPLIKRSGLLDQIHERLFSDLFRNHYFIEWQALQEPQADRPSVYMVTGEDRKGNPYRPRVVKIGRVEVINNEVDRTNEAKELLGSIVPTILAEKQYKGQKAVISEFATADNRDFLVQQFGTYYQDHTSEDIGNLLSRVFTQALFPLYKSQSIVERKYSIYSLPKSGQKDYQAIEDSCKESKFYDPSTDSLRIPGIGKTLPNPGVYLRPGNDAQSLPFLRLFGTPRRIGLSMAHGDSNPRNLLIDAAGNFHVIDFAQLKSADKGCRFMDLTRLETEIKFKLTTIDRKSLDGFIGVEQLLVESIFPNEYARLSQMPFTDDASKLVYVISKMRQLAKDMCAQTTNEVEVDYEYKLGLLAQTLKIATFSDYLSKSQHEFAVISCALLANWLERERRD